MTVSEKIRSAVVLLLLIVMFLPTFRWMNERFGELDSFYAHGYLIPFICGFLVWQRREVLLNEPWKTDLRGFFILLSGVVLHLAGLLFEVHFLSGLALVIVITGLVLFNLGRKISRLVAFPLFFMLFMVPLPAVITLGVSFRLKLIAAEIAGYAAGLFIPLKTAGSLIFLPNGVLTVGAPCSGLKSIITLSALSLLFAYLTEFTLREKALFFLLSLPLAFLANVIRIILLIIVFYVYGSEAALGKFHDFSGFLVFLIALAGLFLLKRIFQIWPIKKTA